MNKSQILHDIAMTLQAKRDFAAGCSAGCTATSGAIRIIDKDGNNFIVTVQTCANGNNRDTINLASRPARR